MGFVRRFLASNRSAANAGGRCVLATSPLCVEIPYLFMAVKVVKVAGLKNRTCKPLMVNAVKPSPSKSK